MTEESSRTVQASCSQSLILDETFQNALSLKFVSRERCLLAIVPGGDVVGGPASGSKLSLI